MMINRLSNKIKSLKSPLIVAAFVAFALILPLSGVFGASSDFTYYNDSDPDFIKIHTNNYQRKEIQEFVDYDLDFRDVEKIEVKAKVTADSTYGLGFWFGLYYPTSGRSLAAGIPGNIKTDEMSFRPLSQDNIISSGNFYNEWAIFTVELDHSFGTSDEFKATVSAETIDGNYFISDTVETSYPQDSSLYSLDLQAMGDEMMMEEVTAEVEYIFISGDKTDDPSPSEPEPFDGFDAETLAPTFPDDFTVNMNGIVNSFGSYNWGRQEDQEDFLAVRSYLQEEVDGTWVDKETDPGTVIPYDDGVNITQFYDDIDPGGYYRYHWRFKYIDFFNGNVIDDYWTDYEYFGSPTTENDPVLTTLPAQDITQNSAGIRGEILDLGDNTEVTVYFEWRQAISDPWQTTNSGTFSEPIVVYYTISGLDPDTNYSYRLRTDEVIAPQETLTTSGVPIDPPDDIDDPQTWSGYYSTYSDDDFSAPIGFVDNIASVISGMMTAINDRITPFLDIFDAQETYNAGRDFGSFVPIANAYMNEVNGLFGGVPISAVFTVFLVIQIVILGVIGVKALIDFIPFV